jgi:hypothetical protein
MRTQKQMILDLNKEIKKELKAGKDVKDICNSRNIKKIVKEYNTKTGYVINDYQLKRMVKSMSPKKSSRKSRKSRRVSRKSRRVSHRKSRKSRSVSRRKSRKSSL